MTTKKRRHHYIWQHYLSAWNTDGMIACLRGAKIFSTSTRHVGVRTDFHKISECTANDLLFIRRYILGLAPHLQPISAGWIPFFRGPGRVQELARSLKADVPEIRDGVSKMFSNREEDLHSSIERKAIDHLDSLKSGQLGFLASKDPRAEFIYFMCTQHFRTAKQRDRFSIVLRSDPRFNPDAIWPVIRHVLATSFGAELFLRWGATRVVLLEAPIGSELITGDQPVINMQAIGLPPGRSVEKLKFYYPVSPRRALLWDVSASSSGIVVEALSPSDIDMYNKAILQEVHEQAYATSQDILLSLSESVTD